MMPHLMLALWLLQTPNPDSVLSRIGIDQNLNAQIDPELSFVDESGKPVRLGDYFGSKPIIMTPVYYSCPMLCPMALNGFVKALRVMPFAPGKEFRIITFSIDPNEGHQLANERRAQYLRDYNKPVSADGWHFLTGSTDAVAQLTSELGYRYTFDPNTNQWAHASAVVVLTPDGHISQYWYGVEYDPGDLRLSLVQASNGKVGSVVDHALLYCFQYDPRTGKYSLMIMRIVRVFGIATVLCLFAFMRAAWRRPTTPAL
jgi:protein SCO1/2